MATHINSAHISQQLTRMEGAVDTDLELAIGTAKEFVESVCKTILDECQVNYDKSDDVPTLVKKTVKVLQLTPDDVARIQPGPRTRSSAYCRTLERLCRGLPSCGTRTGRGMGGPRRTRSRGTPDSRSVPHRPSRSSCLRRTRRGTTDRTGD